MKRFLGGFFVGISVCLAFSFTNPYIFKTRFNHGRNKYLDDLYYSSPREGKMTEWLYSVEELPLSYRKSLCKQLEECAETFLIAYIGVSVTNQDELVSLINRHIPIKQIVENKGSKK